MPGSTPAARSRHDPDLLNTVVAEVDSVAIDQRNSSFSGTNPLTLEQLKTMLHVHAGVLDANPGDPSNLNWSFNSGSENFNFLADGETLSLQYTVLVSDDSAEAHVDHGHQQDDGNGGQPQGFGFNIDIDEPDNRGAFLGGGAAIPQPISLNGKANEPVGVPEGTAIQVNKTLAWPPQWSGGH